MVVVVLDGSSDGQQQVIARRQRQRGGRNNQMKMMFDSSGGWGRLMVATMENGKAAECSTVAVMANGKAMAQQDSEAATEQEQEADAMLEDKINRQRCRRMGVGGQQAKRRKAGLQLPFSGISTY
jgi:hypothetical protein